MYKTPSLLVFKYSIVAHLESCLIDSEFLSEYKISNILRVFFFWVLDVSTNYKCLLMAKSICCVFLPISRFDLFDLVYIWFSSCCLIYIYIYIYVCVCVCVCITHIYNLFIYIYKPLATDWILWVFFLILVHFKIAVLAHFIFMTSIFVLLLISEFMAYHEWPTFQKSNPTVESLYGI